MNHLKNISLNENKTSSKLSFLLLVLIVLSLGSYIYFKNESVSSYAETIAHQAIKQDVEKNPIPISFKITISKSFAESIVHSIEAKTQLFLLDIQKIKGNRVRNVSINFQPGDKNNYFSKGNLNNCSINIELDSDKFRKLSTEELQFIILHEIGHCQLGTENLAKNIKWDNSFNKEYIEKAQNMFSKQESIFLKNICIDCQNKFENITIASPAIVYHEMTAEALATTWWLQANYDKKFIEKLYEKRFMDFLENPLLNEHPTHFVLQEILKNDKENKLSISNAKISAQIALIAYLQEMEFHYH